jgi:hypothetical protein
MSATYLTDINYIEIKKAVVLPPDIQICGSNPFTVITNINSYPLYMAIELSIGFVLYDFGATGNFTFNGSITGNPIFPSAGYNFQIIQGFGICINYPNGAEGFKKERVKSLPFDLILTTQDGTDATQGDGILNITYYGLKP